MSQPADARPIALMSALTQEIAELRSVLDRASTGQVAGSLVHRGTIDRHAVVLANTGIGKVNAAVTTALVIARYDVRMALFTGVAGGLDPGLDVGDVVIADKTVAHDTGVLSDGGLERYQPGHVPFFNPTDRFGYTPDPQLLERVRARLADLELDPIGDRHRRPRVVIGTVLTGDQFVNDSAAREHLHDALGGLAVEMEGAALAQTAERLGVPHLVVRALSDLAGAESHLDFTEFVTAVSRNSGRLIRHLLPAL